MAHCWGCGAPPSDAAPHQACALCRQEGLPPCMFCGEACLRNAWPAHRAWHEEQRRLLALASEVAAQHWTCAPAAACSPYDQLLEAMSGLGEAATAASTATTATASTTDVVQAQQTYLQTLEHTSADSLGWAERCVGAYALLAQPSCAVAAPAWWNDETLRTLSERVVAMRPDYSLAWRMRGEVLSARLGGSNWPGVAPRTPQELQEAGRALQRAVALGQHELGDADKQTLVQQAVACLRAAQQVAQSAAAIVVDQAAGAGLTGVPTPV